MNSGTYLLRRVLWSLFVIWFILTATFLLFVAVPDFNKTAVQWGLSPEKAEEAKEEYMSQMHYDEPLLERYLHWMKAYATMDWGRSFVKDRPVTAIVGEAAPVTLGYLLPSIVLAYVLGTLEGLYSAIRRVGPLKRIGNAIVYSGLALPTFWLGWMLFFLAHRRYGLDVGYDPGLAVLAPKNLKALVLPTLVMSLNLGAVYARYTRAETRGYLSDDFVKTIRANGGSSRDVARHTYRNAMPPLVSLFFTRTTTVLLLSVYAIEVVFGLPGLGRITLSAIEERDVAVILAMTFITVLVGVLGNLVQDLAYGVIDPRIGSTDG